MTFPALFTMQRVILLYQVLALGECFPNSLYNKRLSQPQPLFNIDSFVPKDAFLHPINPLGHRPEFQISLPSLPLVPPKFPPMHFKAQANQNNENSNILTIPQHSDYYDDKKQGQVNIAQYVDETKVLAKYNPESTTVSDIYTDYSTQTTDQYESTTFDDSLELRSGVSGPVVASLLG